MALYRIADVVPFFSQLKCCCRLSWSSWSSSSSAAAAIDFILLHSLLSSSSSSSSPSSATVAAANTRALAAIFVKNLPFDMSEDAVQALFEEAIGPIVQARLILRAGSGVCVCVCV